MRLRLAILGMSTALLACGQPGQDGDEDGTSTGEESGPDTGSGETDGSSGSDDTGDTDTDSGESDETGEAPVCGDGVIDPGEQCDDGDQNGEYDRCNLNCAGLGPHCGDEIVNGPEDCDDGDLDGLDGCTNQCTSHVCGDMQTDPGELCFESIYEIELGHDPGPLLVLDLDEDAHLDVVIGNVSESEVVVALGDGTGQFGPPEFLPGPELVHLLRAGDFDDDGDLDVVAFGRTEGWCTFLGDGNGTLSPAPCTDLPLESGSVAELNGDGRTDLVVGRAGGTQAWLSNGDGSFGLQGTTAHMGWLADYVISADFDGDQRADLALALDEEDSLEPTGELRTLFGVGNGDLQAGATHAIPDDAEVLKTATLDGDLRPDLIALRGAQPCEGAQKSCGGDDWLDPINGEITVLASAGNPPGVLTQTSSIVVGFDPSDLAIADMDADQHLDVVVAHFAYSWLELLRGDGAGQLAEETIIDSVGFRHVDVEIADLDEDGVGDIMLTRSALGNDAGALRIRLSNP